jgi:[protein-PII] uridylyltransferase
VSQTSASKEKPAGAEPLHQIAAQFRADRDPFLALESRTTYTDTLVTDAASHHLLGKVSPRLLVAAIGGYGRRELFPYSDVDLLFAVESESDLEGLKEPLSECLRVLWDSGLRVSHSVRTLAECCRLIEGNTELHISLLDLRFLTGDRTVFSQLEAKLPEFYVKQAAVITRRLAQLARQRHAKYNATVFHLEPNIKEAPGGIRDIHLLRWLAQLNPFHSAVRESLEELEEARRFLFALRCGLHIETGRDNNLLTFELQDRLAAWLPAHSEIPEHWMRRYYASAREIFRPSLQVLDQVEGQDPSLLKKVRDYRSRFSTGEFTVSKDRVFLRNPAETLQSTEAIFRLFTFIARHGFQLSWDTQRRLRAGGASPIAEAMREHAPTRLVWREMLSQPHAGLALREMADTGLLAIYIPEWREIDSLVVRDFYHRYTVDEHTLVAIETIDNLLANKPGTPPRFYELVVEEDDLTVLRFALLLHDIGKGTEPGNHVHGSMHSARHILDWLEVPEAKKSDVKFLIEHHLDLSLVMNGRDLEDPATARFLTGRVGTQERLRQLTLLTYADINAVNPTAMTPWRLEQLWRVYTLGLEQLTRDLAMDRIRRGNALEQELAGSPEIASFLEGLPTRYLRTHSREEIERHCQLSKAIARDGVAVEIVKEAGAYVMAVLAADNPGLFAPLCGALASFGMNIVKAEAFSNAAGQAVDVFRFEDPMRTLELNPGEVERLRWTIECVVRGSIEVMDLLKRRKPARVPSSGAKILPHVRFNNDASDSSTLIDFVGEDRPGLLYDLASAMSDHGCNIEVVMIDTEGHKAIDVFYVTRNDAKLDDFTQAILQENILRIAMRS